MKKNIRLPSLGFIAAVLFSSTTCIYSTDYYVSPTGNDTNSGTQIAPWASINKGVDLYNPGDTLWLRGGTYSLTTGIYFYRSGTAASPITFRSFPGETVIIDGAAIPNTNTLIYINANYFVMQDLEIRNSKQNGITVQGGTFVTLSNCTVHDSQYSGIFVGNNDLTSTHDVTVQNCTVYNNCHMNDPHTLNGGWPGALVIGRANTVTVKNNNVYQNNGEGIIFFLVDNCRSTSNIAHDNYAPNMYIDNATNCVVERNMLYSTLNPSYFRNGSQTTGIQFANEPYSFQNPSNNITIINNVLVNNNYAFYYGNYGIGGGLKNFTFANNTIYTSKFEAIHVDADAHSNAVFNNNVCSQNAGGTQSVLPATLTGLTFSNNLWFGPAAGAAAGSGDVNADPKFISAGSTVAANYGVQSGTPAKGVGKLVAAVAVDFTGASRSQPIDMGAFIAPAGSAPTVNHPPVLSGAPTCTPNPALVNQTMTFTASATDADNDPLTYTWDMGNGTTANGPSVTIAYASAAVYIVKVTVTDGKGGSDSKSVSATVNVAPPPTNHPPVLSAVPTCTPNPSVIGQTVSFSATATDADNDPLTYTWNMGNGAILAGPSVTQVYAAAGVFNISVTVTDGKGGSDSKSVSLTVNTAATNHPPVLSAIPTCTPNPCVIGQALTFAASATDADGDPLTYTWDMGNGTIKTGSSVAQVYSAAATYTVKVTVTDGKGGSDTKSIAATVNSVSTSTSTNHPPVLSAAPAFTPNPATVGQVMTFTANATDADNDPLVYTWNMGNGSILTGKSVNLGYAAAGNYTVSVTVTDGKGGSDTKSVTAVVSPTAPPANHSPVLAGPPTCTPNPVNGSLAMTFTASATDADNDPLTYTWDMGNGQTQTGQTITQVYAAPGTYVVTVTVSDGRGGKDSKPVSAVVNPAIAPVIASAPSYAPNPGVVGQPVMFSAAATEANNNKLTYSWNMGDGNSFTGPTVSNTYVAMGQYTVTLTVTDVNGGNISVSIPATINKAATPMNIQMVSLTLDTKSHNDSLVVSGSVPLPAGIKLDGANAVISMGSFSYPVTLTAKGVSTDKTMKLTVKTMKGSTPMAAEAPLVLNIKKKPLQSMFSDFKLDLTKSTGNFPVTVNLVIGDTTYSSSELPAKYTVK